MTVGQQLIEQGRVEGRVEGIVSVLSQLLTRLGVSPTGEQIGHLRGQSPEVLEALAATLLDASDTDAARALLQRHLDDQR
jgi:hypothetical protein